MSSKSKSPLTKIKNGRPVVGGTTPRKAPHMLFKQLIEFEKDNGQTPQKQKKMISKKKKKLPKKKSGLDQTMGSEFQNLNKTLESNKENLRVNTSPDPEVTTEMLDGVESPIQVEDNQTPMTPRKVKTMSKKNGKVVKRQQTTVSGEDYKTPRSELNKMAKAMG